MLGNLRNFGAVHAEGVGSTATNALSGLLGSL